MRIIPLLLIIGLLFPAVSPAQTNAPHHQQYESSIRIFEAQDKQNPPPPNAILLVGSSSIRKWTNAPAQFPERHIINRGFGGSHLGDSVAFAERIVIPYHPKIVALYAGDNDLAGGLSPEKVFADFKAFVKKVRTALPETQIVYIAIKPSPSRKKFTEKIKTANHLIEEFTKQDSHLTYLDVYTPMLTADGQMRPELFVKDMLHMNDAGYDLWASLIRPVFEKYDSVQPK